MSEIVLLGALHQVQVPLLAVALIAGGAAKVRRAAAARSVDAGTGPTVLFPAGLRRLAAVGLCAAELVLGAGLLLTAGGTGPAVLVIRGATALLFCVAACALHELRTRRPEAGCGCFGPLSRTPVGTRAISRAVLLGAGALWSVSAPALHRPVSPAQAWALLLAVVAELTLLTALSPEVVPLVRRLSRQDPCELRRVPVAQTLSALHASVPWRRYRQYLDGPGPADSGRSSRGPASAGPADVWREGCWRFVVYPGTVADRRVDVVFAVRLGRRRPPVEVGLLDAGTAGSPATEPLQLSNLV
jgi:hypothetical protein